MGGRKRTRANKCDSVDLVDLRALGCSRHGLDIRRSRVLILSGVWFRDAWHEVMGLFGFR